MIIKKSMEGSPYWDISSNQWLCRLCGTVSGYVGKGERGRKENQTNKEKKRVHTHTYTRPMHRTVFMHFHKGISTHIRKFKEKL